jgi:CheY-like chemotaxis protein
VVRITDPSADHAAAFGAVVGPSGEPSAIDRSENSGFALASRNERVGPFGSRIGLGDRPPGAPRVLFPDPFVELIAAKKQCVAPRDVGNAEFSPQQAGSAATPTALIWPTFRANFVSGVSIAYCTSAVLSSSGAEYHLGEEGPQKPAATLGGRDPDPKNIADGTLLLGRSSFGAAGDLWKLSLARAYRVLGAKRRFARTVTTSMPRVLLLDDEPLITMFLEDILAQLEYEIVGPAHTVAVALGLIEATPPDAAILDMNLGKELSYPAADALRIRRIPFMFLTGYVAPGIDPRFHNELVMTKPFDFEKIRQGLNHLFDPGRSAETVTSSERPPGSP